MRWRGWLKGCRQRQDAPRLDQHRYPVQVAHQAHPGGAGEGLLGLVVDPGALRDPHIEYRHVDLGIGGVDNGRGDHLVPEVVLVAGSIRCILGGMLVVHGPAERDAGVVGHAGHGVDIGHQLVA